MTNKKVSPFADRSNIVKVDRLPNLSFGRGGNPLMDSLSAFQPPSDMDLSSSTKINAPEPGDAQMNMEEQKRNILSIVAEQVGSENSALDWYRSYTIPGFGKTPSQLVRMGLYKALLRHIERKEKGEYA